MTAHDDDKEVLPVQGGTRKLDADQGGGVTQSQMLVVVGFIALLAVVAIWRLVYQPTSPSEVPEPAPAPHRTEQTRPSATPAAATLLPEQLAWRDEALAVLEALTPRLLSLERRALADWAADEHKALRGLVASGEEAYAEQRFRDARDFYADGLAQVETLEAALPAAFADYEARGMEEIAQKRYDEALAILEIAGQMDPDHAGVAAAINTAQNGEAVDRLVTKAAFALDEGEPGEASGYLRQASTLDPARADVRQLAARATAMARQQAFASHMRAGHTALAAERFDDALAAFGRALKLEPGREEAASAVAGAVKQKKDYQLAEFRKRGAEAMVAETWADAAGLYKQALLVQPDVAFAKMGLQQATFYGEKQKQIAALLARPERLSDKAVAGHAASIIAELDAGPGTDTGTDKATGPPAGLARARDSLQAALKASNTLVPVTVTSDGRSSISVVRGQSYSPFKRKTLELKPGNYTLLARRKGYRDKRISFQVPLDGQPVTVTIGADEKL
ncbi:hypothetical protein [Kordiimonas sp.]|uniref:hypothetical protein n=1 Tax=Kordiimonas sp. TaxID=1970157 RepID=UPI003A8EF2B5